MPGETPSAPASSTPNTSTRGRGTPRPRAGVTRKSKAERDQFAKEEAARVAARAAEHEAANRGARGGRAVNRGGRGGAPSNQRAGPVGGGGVFGGGGTTTQSKQKYEAYAELLDGGTKSGGPGPPGQGVGDGDTGTASQSKTGGRGAGVRGGGKPDAGGGNYVAGDENVETTTDDEPEDGPKRDIERIWISSDEDQDIITSSSKKGKHKAASTAQRPPRSGLGLRPVRAPRTLKEEDGGRDGRQPTTARRKRGSTGKKADIEPLEVSSDDRDVEAMDVDPDSSHSIPRDQTISPDLRKKTLKRQQPLIPPVRWGRDAKVPANETTEERAERLRAQEDVEKLRNIFLPKTTVIANDAAIDDSDELETSTSGEGGQFILFQLPPLTPFLSDPSTNTTGAPDQEIKAEPAPLATVNATIDLDSIPDAPATAAQSAPPAHHDGGPAKPDLDTAAPPQQQLQTEGFLTASEPLRLPAGWVGKLHLHKSGKVTLDWGGTDMQVMLGTEVDFLQDVVLVTPPRNAGGDRNENGEDPIRDDDLGGISNLGNDEEKGQAYALGHVRQKVVLILDWAKLYD